MKRIETSKKILWFCDSLLVLTVIATFVAAFLKINEVDVDVSSLVQLVMSLSGLSAAAHSFYYWKAKAENLQKYGPLGEVHDPVEELEPELDGDDYGCQ